MALQIVGAGYGRTGTASLKKALEMLGYAPCHHMSEVFQHQEQVPFWDRAAQGQTMNWDEVFSSYRASCDWPSCAFYKELADFYPQAKVILTLRDPQSWFKSVSATILNSMRKSEPGRRVLPGIFGPLLIGEKTFGNDFSEAHMIDVFERHNAEVKQTISRDRLLVFEAREGWGPLCEFLGKPVPAVPYPKANSTDEFLAHARH